ncbi:isopentenyl-diphosphate Delta-isomerase [Candidatus Parcubacteria bacterium]|nr:isopentenyl-diphosphate Delta-isomerase [Candidatus Parcubacteria bacterium]
MKEKVILVDKKDKKIGTEEKLKAHKEGKLHRAISVFLFNKKGELLIQKRAKEKYHSGGLWANTCCTHPRPKEKTIEAAKRRLKEEMGIEAKLKKLMVVKYKAKVGDLIENEIDHVFFGISGQNPKPDKREVESWRWENPKKILKEMEKNPQKFAVWFRIILPKVLKKIKLKNDP